VQRQLDPLARPASPRRLRGDQLTVDARQQRRKSTMTTETSARSSLLREPEITALRRRLLMARHQAATSAEASLTADWHELLLQAHRSYVADVDALLDERRHLFETIAALRRVAVAAEAALFESRAGQQGKRLEALLRALEMAGYGQQENTATQITARTSG